MKHKRLNRDGWGFQYYPYYQMRIDCDYFHGMACLIRFTDGEANYWETPKAGRIQVTGEGMTWLELIPDNTKRVITVKYFPDGTYDEERANYPKNFCGKYRPSIWYVDIIEGIEYAEDGIAVFIDKYLDVIFTPEGDVKIDDRDELDQAHATGELSDEQYTDALTECDHILRDLCFDIAKTNTWCSEIRELVEARIAAGEEITKCRDVLQLEKHHFFRRLDKMNRNVFFILGCPCAGKTTVARLLAQKNNMFLLSGDERRFEYYKHADKAKHKYMTMDASSFWDWSLDEMVDWERGVISEQTPMIIEELNTLSEERDLVLFEGMMDIKYLLSVANRDHIVYLTVDREICEKDFFGRGDHNGMLTAIMNTEDISDEEKKRRTEIRRAAAITAFYEDAQSLGLQSFSRKDISSPLEMTYKIEQYFNMA